MEHYKHFIKIHYSNPLWGGTPPTTKRNTPKTTKSKNILSEEKKILQRGDPLAWKNNRGDPLTKIGNRVPPLQIFFGLSHFLWQGSFRGTPVFAPVNVPEIWGLACPFAFSCNRGGPSCFSWGCPKLKVSVLAYYTYLPKNLHIYIKIYISTKEST